MTPSIEELNLTESKLRDEQPLPDGWVWADLGEICATTSGGTPSRKKPSYFGADIPWLKSGELENRLVAHTEEFITEQGLANSSAKIIPRGTLLIALYGATVGKLGILAIDAAINQAICAIFTPPEIDKKYVFWFFLYYRDELLNARIGGAQPNISQRILRRVRIPLPPLPEQHRIVAKIEELFTQLDAGVAALEKAKARLRRYRQAVLKAAVEGELTREWREAHRGELEPASVLLERILEERRARWEAAHPGKRYKLPTPPETDKLPGLPERWVWASLKQLAERIQYGHTESARDEPIGPKFLRITDIQDGRVNWDTVPYCKCSEEQYAKYRLLPGDIVFTRTGATTGKSYLISDCPDAVFASYLIRLQIGKQLNTKYVALFLTSPMYWSQIMIVKKGSAQPGVNATILATLNVPLPPLAEQYRIVAEVEQRLSVSEEMEKAVDQSLKRAERLRQSILKRAFEGKLAPQDPSDEAASVLLERIKAEKARREGEGKGRKRSRKKKQTRRLELFTP